MFSFPVHCKACPDKILNHIIEEIDCFSQDGKLVCTMTGHKSVVSALVVLNGVLYSGSWDGTVRLWSLSDHSFLTVLGEETQGIVKSILSLAADEGTLVAAYQNGDIQVFICS